MGRYPQIKVADPNSHHGQWFNKLFDKFISPLLRLRPFQNAYSRAKADPASLDTWTKILQQLNTTLVISAHDLAQIPSTGPVVIVANHPHGIMDGVLIGSLLHRVRDDFKIIMNEATTMPGLEDSLLFVSIFGSPKENAKKNIQVMRQALEWLKAGHVIFAFPAGEISAIQSLKQSVALDNIWNSSMMRLAMRAQAPVLPLCIVGQNDPVFLKLGLIHPLFRTIQIGRVTNHLFGKTILVRAGQPTPHKILQTFKNDEARADFIRSKVYALLSREWITPRVFDALALDIVNTDKIQEAFDQLNAQPDLKIRQNGRYTVFLFDQQQLPNKTFSVLKDEIGRLRELTFREIGEGSNSARDLDQYDEYYSHLTLWDHEQKQLVGAYRIGFIDKIFPQYGIPGLYTASQFDFNPKFFETIGTAMEVSRAFIIKEHQKSPMSLSTLLGALGQVMVERSHIRSFFGAVSISNQFQPISKKIIINYLTQYHYDQTLGAMITPKNPPKLTTQMPAVEWQRLKNSVQSLSLLNSVVSDIEPDGKTIPPLISTYTSLSGRFIGFDVDAAFNSIDGLLVVDLQKALQYNPAMLTRLIGKELLGNHRFPSN